MRLELLFSFFAFAILFAGFATFSAAAQQTTNVTILDGSGLGLLCVAERNCFDPPLLHIVVGTTVTWKNNDKFSHTITNGSPYDSQVGDKFDSGLISPGKEFSFTFRNAGTYHYFCELHPWMRGEIDIVHGH